jgi:hypothetical protein
MFLRSLLERLPRPFPGSIPPRRRAHELEPQERSASPKILGENLRKDPAFQAGENPSNEGAAGFRERPVPGTDTRVQQVVPSPCARLLQPAV